MIDEKGWVTVATMIAHHSIPSPWRDGGERLKKIGDEIAEIAKKINNPVCNQGHNDYPLTLWDCPVCVAQKEKQLKEFIVALYSGDLEEIDKLYPTLPADLQVKIKKRVQEVINEGDEIR